MEEDDQLQQLQRQENDVLSFCPSFNSYSSDRFAEIATQVSEEFSADEAPSFETSNDDDDDFEFSLVRCHPDDTAYEFSDEGQIHPIFPIFKRDLLTHDDQDHDTKSDVSALRIPLKKLFVEDRESPSSSSSEADELEHLAPGTYCVWRPKEVEASPSRCNKSNSTGSASKRWKLRDLLWRSNSEGKDSFVLLTPKNREQKTDRNEKVEKNKEMRNSSNAAKVAGRVKVKGAAGVVKASPLSAHEVFYVQNRALKESDKKRSYLPYRQDLVGFFASVNGVSGLSRTFPPF